MILYDNSILENLDWFIAKSILAQGRKYDTMRKQQKKQVSEQISTLYEACCELPKHPEQTFIDLCAEIQEFVSGIFNFVESTAGEGTVTADLLGQLYEMLFKATQYEATTEQLIDLVKKIDESLYDLKIDKIEIVFFCYKASMSDCLSSIYFAAKEDQHCDAYFIPIPYFDRTGDGSIGEMHLEAEGCYSDKFYLTDWRTYNIEEHLPDVVFFMAPYDQHNFVTSVHPDFYSKRLKQYCGLLCYSPYFVSDEYVDFVKSGTEALCATMGAIYADYIFVQSERVKEAWIAAIHKVESVNNSEGAFGDLKKKIVALGSPKFDAVLATRPEEGKYTEDWDKLIEGKKVVVYNTSVSAILKGREQYLKKIRSVIETFKKYNEVVLWWRPHPLMEQTYDSMRHGLAEEWHKIVEQYRREGIELSDEIVAVEVGKFADRARSIAEGETKKGSSFIYDTSSDMHRAIACSDGYYGDRSSVATLFKETGKPVVIQTANENNNAAFNNLQKDEKEVLLEEIVRTAHQFNVAKQPLVMEDIYFDGVFFWFAATNFNSLFRMHRETFQLEWIGFFPDEDKRAFRLYSSIAYCSGKIYFSPMRAKEIAFYDLEHKEFGKIPFEYPTYNVHEYYNEAKFHKVVAFGHCVYFIPYYHNSIICYDTVTKEITSYDDWVNEAESKRIYKERGYFCSCTKADNLLVLPSQNANGVLVFDTNAKTSRWFSMPESKKSNGFYSVCYKDEYFYILRSNGIIYKRKLLKDAEEIQEINLSKADIEDEAFFTSDKSGEYYYLLPHLTSDCAIRLNLNTYESESIGRFGDEKAFPHPYQQYWFAKIVDGFLYASAARSGRFIVYNINTGEQIEKMLHLPVKEMDEIQKVSARAFQKTIAERKVNEQIYEPDNSIKYLESYLDYVTSSDYRRVNMGKDTQNAGTKIFEFIKQEAFSI